jgi:hypothetical protein
VRQLAVDQLDVGAADAAPVDRDDHLSGFGFRVVHGGHCDLAGLLHHDRAHHLTAPSDMPRTRQSCVVQPASTVHRHEADRELVGELVDADLAGVEDPGEYGPPPRLEVGVRRPPGGSAGHSCGLTTTLTELGSRLPAVSACSTSARP